MDQEVCNLFVKYDDTIAKIAVLEHKIQTDNLWPSMAGVELLELSMEQWSIRRKINSAMIKQERNKSLLKRIFKK
jgi:hypothetical protein